MNSALKPVLPQPGVAAPGGQASPAKANVANANHSGALPQGAQNSHHAANNLVGQNLTHHAPAPQVPALAHPVPSMAPVSANMAQMAQNMSHHGNLSHVTQNSVTPTNIAASPNKSASTSAPLSLVQDKPQQPLALTRTLEKKEPDPPAHANGTVESPKSASNASSGLKPQNPELNKDKQDIAKTSPSTPKPPEKPTVAPSTPQKAEVPTPVGSNDASVQPKVATANEAPEKSPSKPIEPKPSPAADVAPTQSDNKTVPESANENQIQEKVATPQKIETPAQVKIDSPAKPEKTKEEPKPEKAAPAADEKSDQPKEEAKEKKEVTKSEPPKPEEPVEKPVAEAPKVEEPKSEDKKPEVKTTPKPKATPKSTMKLATVTPPMRKRRASPKAADTATPAKKPATDGDTPSTPDSRTKRNRTQVQLYQSPTPELTMATKLSASAGRSTPTKPNDDKLIVFYKNEYLAVRNAEGGFYVCQAMQNVYRATRKIKIRWLSQDKSDPSGETYRPDFYDVTDMECVLTTLSLTRAAGGGGAQTLKPAEEARAKSILQRAIKAEQSGAGDANIELTEEHPDGLDLSLYTDESQLEKGRKRGARSSPRAAKGDSADSGKDAATPAKKTRISPKRSPKSRKPATKSAPTPTSTPTPPKLTNKRKSAGTTPIVASTSKTATAVTEKAKASPKRTPVKQAKPEKVETVESTPSSSRTGRRAAAVKAEIKASPATPVPSTSTGKTTRTPRKPPAKK